MSLKLTILGCHSATPRENAHPTSQVLEIKNHVFLIDCGEGTQIQLRKNKISFAKIEHIFISHLHGDHFFGLIGLLSSFGLLGRKKAVTIYGPMGIQKVINLLMKTSQIHQSFPIHFVELSENESITIFEDKKVIVKTIPLKHRIYTNGFLFKEKEELLNLNIDEINKYPEIQRVDYQRIKQGKDFTLSDGYVLKNKKLTLKPKKTLSYAYCSDTSYCPSIIPIVYKADILYHEATFLNEHLELAVKTGHSTVEQAAKIAKKAKVTQLILGHFSSRYKNYKQHLKEAHKVFEHTILAEDNLSIDIPIKE